MPQRDPMQHGFGIFERGSTVVGGLEEFGRDPQNSLVLQAARRIAQEESLSSSAIMQELNAAEIIDRSREYAKGERNNILKAHEAERKALLQEHETEPAEQIQRHAKALDVEQGKQRERDKRHQRELEEVEWRTAAKVHFDILERLRDRNTNRIMWGIQITLFAAFVSSFFLDLLNIMREHALVGLVLKVVLGLVAGPHFLDLIGIKLVSRRFDRLRMWIARRQERRLAQRLTAQSPPT
jgi:hypothetical protein